MCGRLYKVQRSERRTRGGKGGGKGEIRSCWMFLVENGESIDTGERPSNRASDRVCEHRVR